jgi:hypothetical protein
MFYIQEFVISTLFVAFLGYIFATVLNRALGFYTNKNDDMDWSPNMLLSFLVIIASKSKAEKPFDIKLDVIDWYNKQFVLKPFGLCVFCTAFWASFFIYFLFLSADFLIFDFKTLIFAPIVSSYISTRI